MMRSLRIFSVSMVVILAGVLGAAPAQALPPECAAYGTKPTINTLDGGYFVSAFGTIRCDRRVDVIRTTLWLMADDSVVESHVATCTNNDRCPTTILVYHSCGSDNKCRVIDWSTVVGGSYTWCNSDGQDCRTRTIPLAQKGSTVTNPVWCGRRPPGSDRQA